MNTLLLKLYIKFQDLASKEEGQDLVEYGLLLVLITLLCITSIGVIGKAVSDIFSNAAVNISSPPS